MVRLDVSCYSPCQKLVAGIRNNCGSCLLIVFYQIYSCVSVGGGGMHHHSFRVGDVAFGGAGRANARSSCLSVEWPSPSSSSARGSTLSPSVISGLASGRHIGLVRFSSV